MEYYVYQLKSYKGEIFYIGKGTKKKYYNRIEFYKKWEKSKTTNKHLFNKIKKLKGEFIVEIIEVFKNELDSLKYEKKLIKEIGLSNLCNITEGGEGFTHKHSNETKQKMSESKMGKKLTNTHKKLIKEGKLKQINKLDPYLEQIKVLYETHNTSQIAEKYEVHVTSVINFLKKHNLFIPYKNRPKFSEKHKENISKNKTGKKYKNK